MGLRVSLHEEIQGLDIGEHGNAAYPDFVTRKPSYTTISYVSFADKSTPSTSEFAGKS